MVWMGAMIIAQAMSQLSFCVSICCRVQQQQKLSPAEFTGKSKCLERKKNKNLFSKTFFQKPFFKTFSQIFFQKKFKRSLQNVEKIWLETSLLHLTWDQFWMVEKYSILKICKKYLKNILKICKKYFNNLLIFFKTFFSKSFFQNLFFKTFFSKPFFQNLFQNLFFKTFFSKPFFQNLFAKLFCKTFSTFRKGLGFKYTSL